MVTFLSAFFGGFSCVIYLTYATAYYYSLTRSEGLSIWMSLCPGIIDITPESLPISPRLSRHSRDPDYLGSNSSCFYSYA